MLSTPTRLLGALGAASVLLTAPVTAQQVTISNGTASLQVEATDPSFGFTVGSVTGPAGSISFIPTDGWVLSVRELATNSVIPIRSSQVITPPTTVSTSATSFVITYAGVTPLTAPAGLTFDIVIRGDVLPGEDFAELDIEATIVAPTAANTFAIHAIDFLRLRLDRPDTTPARQVAWPVAQGFFADSAHTALGFPQISHPVDFDVTETAFSLMYPGAISMQWWTYQTEGSPVSLYCTQSDGEGFHKAFQIGRYATSTNFDDLGFSVRHFAPESFTTQSYRMPYKATIAAIEGDWRQGARRYRDWARANLRPDPSIPGSSIVTLENNTVLDADFQAAETMAWWTPETCGDGNPNGPTENLRYKSFQNLNALNDDLQQRFSPSQAMPSMIYHWDHNSFNARTGDWFPANDDAVNALLAPPVNPAQPNQPTGLYFQYQYYDITLANYPGFIQAGALEFKNAGSEAIRPQPRRIKEGRDCGDSVLELPNLERALNPKALQTQSYSKLFTQSVAGALDADGIYFDALPNRNAVLSYDPLHGHTLGGGNWWAEGHRQILRDARDAGESAGNGGRPFFVVSEGPHELTMDLLDGTIWNTTTDPLPGSGVFAAPLFNTVFHDYSKSLEFGSPILPKTHFFSATKFRDGAYLAARQAVAVSMFAGAMPSVGGVLPEDPASDLATLIAGNVAMDRNLQFIENYIDVVRNPAVRNLVVFGERYNDRIDLGSNSENRGNFLKLYQGAQPFVYGVMFRREATNEAGLLLINWTDDSDALLTNNPLMGAGTQSVSNLAVSATDLGIIRQAGYTQTVYSSGQGSVVTNNIDFTSPVQLGSVATPLILPPMSVMMFLWN